MAVFGIIMEIQSKIGTSIFIIVLAVLVMLEFMTTAGEELAERYGYREIFEKLKKELTILGVISFSVFVYQATIATSTTSSWFLAFEMAHVIALFMAISFIVQAVLIIRYSSRGAKKLTTALRTPFEDLIEQYQKLNQNMRSFRSLAFHLCPSSIPFYPNLRSYIEYRIIEKYFLSRYPLPVGFKFSKYAILLFKNYMPALGEVGPFSWGLICVFVAINYARIALIDNTSAKSSVCNSSSSGDDHSDYHTDHHSLEKGCLEYTLSIGLFCGFALCGFTIGVYVASCAYYDKIIFRILGWDGIDTQNGREGYMEFLEKASQDEEHFRKLTQRSYLNFCGIRKTLVDNSDAFTATVVGRKSIRTYDVADLHGGSEAFGSVVNNSGGKIVDSTNSGKFVSIEDYRNKINIFKLKKQHHIELIRSRPVFIQFTHYIEKGINSFLRHDRQNVLTHDMSFMSRSIDDNSDDDISGVFLLKSPELHLKMVQLGLLMQCFYVSIWSTQLMPLAMYSDNEVFFIAWTVALIVVSASCIAKILRQNVLMQTLLGLNIEVLDASCHETLEEGSISNHIRDSIIEILKSKNPETKYWTKLLRDMYDEIHGGNRAYMTLVDLRQFLGNLNIFIPKHKLDIIWEAIDIDGSGSISFEELFIIVFPEYRYDIQHKAVLIDNFRHKFHQLLEVQKIPKSSWTSYVHNLFSNIAGEEMILNEYQFRDFLHVLGFHYLTEKEFYFLYIEADSDVNDKITFHGVRELLQLNGLTLRKIISSIRRKIRTTIADEATPPTIIVDGDGDEDEKTGQSRKVKLQILKSPIYKSRHNESFLEDGRPSISLHSDD